MTAEGAASSDDVAEGSDSPAERVSNPYGVQVRRPTLNEHGKPSPPPERRLDLIHKVRVPEVREQRRLPMPSREQLVQLALDTYKLALDNTKTYTNRRGAITTEPAPDYRSACDAIRVAAQVAGYTLKGSEPRRSGVAEEDLDAEEALDKLRSKAAKKAQVSE